MKKIIRFLFPMALIIILSVAFWTGAAYAYGEKYTYGAYEYTLDRNSGACLTKYSGDAASLSIPAVVDGCSVKKISQYCFDGNDDIVSVRIPEGVTEVDKWAFFYCHSLKNVILPASLTTAAGAFESCASLESITVSPENPYLEVIGGILFSKKDGSLICYPPTLPASSYTVPDGVTAIGRSAFSSNENLNTVILPDSVAVIDSWAFTDCTYLQQIEFGNGLRQINSYAFEWCDNLKEITIPGSVTEIEESAFEYTALTSVRVSPQNPRYTVIDNVLYDMQEKVLLYCPSGSDNTLVNIPDGILAIAEDAFSSNKIVETVIIPPTVMSIGYSAFDFADSLRYVAIPSSVTEIGNYAFSNDADVTLFVEAGSYAEEYARNNDIRYMDIERLSEFVSVPAGQDDYNVKQGVTAPSGGMFGRWRDVTDSVQPPRRG